MVCKISFDGNEITFSEVMIRTIKLGSVCLHLVPALKRQRQGISEFDDSLVYTVSSNTVKASKEKPCLKMSEFV